jgi:holo-[acyl-carrier protein] synthase
MLRTGIDLLTIARVERALARYGERFYARFFTPEERALCAGSPPRLAARIAAKEAAAKALGVGIGDVRWVEIEIVQDERSRPVLRLHGAALALAERLGLTEWRSASLENAQAAAVVVMMGPLSPLR